MNNKIFSLIIGVLSVILFWIGWVSLNPSDKKAMARFVSVENLVNNEISTRTKLGGIVKEGSIEISKSNQLDCFFVLKEGSAELAVNYSKTRPDLFKDGAEVIVTGEYRNGIFVADELQTKCASRYEGDLREESNYKLDELET
tara:strand:- start:549 stop:977 length:429 start_codon:yes stop_codon:yes gene_type:complete